MGLRKSETAESATVPPAFANWPLGSAREHLKDQQRVQTLEFPAMATAKAAVLDSGGTAPQPVERRPGRL